MARIAAWCGRQSLSVRGKTAAAPTRDAGIAYEDAAGKVADFHALRHYFCTALASGGVHPRTAHSLARHSSVELTLSRHSHSLPTDEAAALDALPDLTSPPAEVLTAAGTDDSSIHGDERMESVAVAVAVGMKSGESGRIVANTTADAAGLADDEKSLENAALRSVVNPGELPRTMRPARFERATCGLGNHCKPSETKRFSTQCSHNVSASSGGPVDDQELSDLLEDLARRWSHLPQPIRNAIRALVPESQRRR